MNARLRVGVRPQARLHPGGVSGGARRVAIPSFDRRPASDQEGRNDPVAPRETDRELRLPVRRRTLRDAPNYSGLTGRSLLTTRMISSSVS